MYVSHLLPCPLFLSHSQNSCLVQHVLYVLFCLVYDLQCSRNIPCTVPRNLKWDCVRRAQLLPKLSEGQHGTQLQVRQVQGGPSIRYSDTDLYTGYTVGCTLAKLHRW